MSFAILVFQIMRFIIVLAQNRLFAGYQRRREVNRRARQRHDETEMEERRRPKIEGGSTDAFFAETEQLRPGRSYEPCSMQGGM